MEQTVKCTTTVACEAAAGLSKQNISSTISSPKIERAGMHQRMCDIVGIHCSGICACPAIDSVLYDRRSVAAAATAVRKCSQRLATKAGIL